MNIQPNPAAVCAADSGTRPAVFHAVLSPPDEKRLPSDNPLRRL